MKSERPKVVHEVAGRPILSHVLAACSALEPELTLVVVGHKYEAVLPLLAEGQAVRQHEQLGTGHAVLITESRMRDFDGPVLVLAGDVPLINTETLKGLVDIYEQSRPAAVLVCASLEDPFGYGRVIRDAAGGVRAIIEEKDAAPEEKLIRDINAGIYCFDARRLFGALAAIGNENHQGEYYLTDVVEILRKRGEVVLAYQAQAEEIIGVNSRSDLARAETVMQGRVKKALMAEGVTFILPETSFVAAGVRIGPDSSVLPHCYLDSGTVIGSRAKIGPGAKIAGSTIGSDVKVEYAVINECTIEDGAAVGPFCSLRPGTTLRRGAKAGTFVEVKQSEIGPGSKVPHLSYIGDTEIGTNVNVGAGSITCNYDGLHKHRTVIEDGAFIGSDTMLVAPVRIGRQAVTGAGSSITADVPPESLAVERSDQRIIKGWAKKRRKRVENE